MNIKVLPLENWAKDDAKSRRVGVLGTAKYPEMEPVFKRDGVYLNGEYCWMEIRGRAYRYSASDFKHRLKMLDAERYNHRQIKALQDICSQKLATKHQKELLYSIAVASEVREVGRRSRLYVIKYLKPHKGI
jgi:hypothetical protein